MIGIVQGVVGKTGANDKGDWFIVQEGPIKKRDGGEFFKSYLCSVNGLGPATGDVVVVQGYLRADVSEHNSKYVDVKLNGCSFHVLSSEAAPNLAAVPDYPVDEDLGGEIPFHHLPRDRYGVTRCGHLRW